MILGFRLFLPASVGSFFGYNFLSYIGAPPAPFLNPFAMITDINLNGPGCFYIEWNGQWEEVDTVEFFDYLYHTNQISGHDPEEETAWTEDRGSMSYSHAHQEMRWSGRCCSRSYRAWLEHFADKDEVLAEYLKIQSILSKAA